MLWCQLYPYWYESYQQQCSPSHSCEDNSRNEGSITFLILDLQSGYRHLELDEDSKKKAQAFIFSCS